MRFTFSSPKVRRRRWDAKRRAWVDQNNRIIPAKKIRREVDDYIITQKAEIEAKAKAMVAGSVTTAAFFGWMRERVGTMHRKAGSLAYGRMTPKAEARIEERILGEMKYLSGFELDAAVDLTDASWPVSRAAQYAEATYATYENSVRDREGDSGAVGVRRVSVDDDSSCEECPDLASDEYVGLAEVRDIGDTVCRSNCRCFFEFSYEGVEPLTIDRRIYANVKLPPVFLFRR